MVIKIARYIAVMLPVLFLASCKGEFERVRASGDPQFILVKANEYFEKEEYLKAQTLYEQILTSFRGKAEAEQLYFNYANTHYNMGNYILSAFYFSNFSETFPSSPRREDASFMSAYSNYRLSPVPALDQASTKTAIAEFETFANTYTQSPRIPEVNKLIDELRAKLEVKAYRSSKLYYDMKQYQSASRAFKNLLQEYPETKKVDEIRYLIIKSAYLMAKNSVISRQEERYEEVLKEYNNYKSKLNSTPYYNEIVGMVKDSESRLKYLKNG